MDFFTSFRIHQLHHIVLLDMDNLAIHHIFVTLPTSQRAWVAWLPIFRSTFCFCDLKCTLRLISNPQIHMMSSKPFGLQPPSIAFWAWSLENNHMFQLVSACCVYNKCKSETNPSECCAHKLLLPLSVLFGRANNVNQSSPYCNIFRCGGGQCLPICVQVLLYAKMVIITEMKNIYHSRLPPPLKPRN